MVNRLSFPLTLVSVSLEQFVCHELLGSSDSWLSQTEQERLSRHRSDRRRQQFLLGRVLLRWLLHHYGFGAPETYSPVTDEYGKPEFQDREGQVPLYSSISHSGDRLMIGLSGGQALGVDLEVAGGPTRPVESLAQRFFSRSEYEELAALPVGERLRRFYQLWTLKEAIVKASGTGLLSGLKGLRLEFPEHDQIRLIWPRPRVTGADGNSWRLCSFCPQPGYQAAVATQSQATAAAELICLELEPTLVLRPVAVEWQASIGIEPRSNQPSTTRST